MADMPLDFDDMLLDLPDEVVEEVTPEPVALVPVPEPESGEEVDHEPFVHLHVHTEYSLLDGLAKVDKLVKRAKALGMKSLAITDHGVMHGVIQFYRACKENQIKPIIGMEGYLARKSMHTHDQTERKPFHMLLIAKDNTGYQNLLKIASAAQLQGFYAKPRIDKDFLAAHAKGLIATSGCLAAEIPALVNDGKEDEARRMMGVYQDIFGKENFFLELQNHEIPELFDLNKWLYQNRDFAGAGLIATNDVHYVLDADYDPHDTLLCIQTGALKTDAKRMRMTDASYHLRSKAEMWALFREMPDALYNTLKIEEMCDVNLDTPEGKDKYHLPNFAVPPGYDSQSFLKALALKGLEWRYGSRAHDSALLERLEYELRVINDLGFNTYFLIVWDLCQFARHADIWWNVRGSGAGAVTAYVLGITNIDPIRNNLIFERFLNPGRSSMPDIDMDFPDDRRAELIDYAMRKYGSDKVAAIITFGTMKARAAIKDVGRVLGYDLALVNSLTQLVPQIPSRPVTLADCLGDDPDKSVQELKTHYATNDSIRKLLDAALTVEGVARNAGTHAAGVIISDKPLVEYLPLHRPIGDTRLAHVTQFPMEICESIGLLKVDFLGLSTLTIMRKACDLIARYHGVKFTMDNIPYRPDPDDPVQAQRVADLYKLVGNGETTGVFQLESPGMKKMIREMKPQTFEHIIAAISLYRPGPMDMIPSYVSRMHGVEPIQYLHPKLENILQETYGICVYQEQIQQIAANLFGYTLGEADLMRRAVSKKKKKDLDKHKTIFMEKGPENNVSVEVAEKIFDQIEFFAAYGFNKCVVGDTQIIDADTGRLVRIADLAKMVESLPNTITCQPDTFRLAQGAISAVMENGIKPTYKLVTNLGHEIEATDNHPFLTCDGWKHLGDLKVGEMIAVSRHIHLEGRKAWPDHALIVLGHLLAEGNLCHPTGMYYYTNDPDQCADYVMHAEQFENVSATVHRRRVSAHDVYARKTHYSKPNGLAVWIESLGLRYATSYTKFIPAEVFELKNRNIALLISRMWEGDGSIRLESKFLYYASSSKRMITELQHLLLRFGIVSRVRKVVFRYKEGRTGYQLHITGYDNLKRFQEQISIHFVSAKRREALLQLVSCMPTSFGTKDVIPTSVSNVVRDLKTKSGWTWDKFEEVVRVSATEFQKPSNTVKKGFTRSTIRQIADYFDSPELHKYSESDVYWDTVTSITYAGEQMTYDLTVPGTHNFVANNIIVHNSHAADYAVLTCQTAYLKAHYPEEYYTALLSVQRDVIADVALYTSDCRRFGIPVLPPDINGSDDDFAIQDVPDRVRDDGSGKTVPVRGIRYGLSAIKSVGEKAIQAVVAERIQNGDFKDLADFCLRVDMRSVGKKALESLVKVGAFDSMKLDRDDLLASVERLIRFSAAGRDQADGGQINMFESADADMLVELTLDTAKEKTDSRTRMTWEKELIGLPISEHPLTPLRDQIKMLSNAHFTDELRQGGDDIQDMPVTLVGMVGAFRVVTTRKGDDMAVVTLEDERGSCDVVLFPRTYSRYKDMIEKDRLIIVRGKVDAKRGDIQVIADNVSDQFDEFDLGEAAYPAAQPADQNGYGTGGSANGYSAAHTEPDNGNGYNANGHTPYQSAATVEPSVVQATAFMRDMEDFLTDEQLAAVPPRLITLRFERSEDIDRDRRKFEHLLRQIKSEPGIDHYQFEIIAPEEVIMWRPTVDTTTNYDRVRTILEAQLGVENIVIDIVEENVDENE